MVLRLHSEAVGHPGDVVEVSDHLSGIVNGAIVEPVGPQKLDIGRPHVVLMERELHRMGTQGPIGVRQRRRPPVPGDGVNESIRPGGVIEELLDLGTEVMRMRLSSVEAPVGP